MQEARLISEINTISGINSGPADIHGYGDIENSKDELLVKFFVDSQNEEAFTELVNRYSDKVYRLAYRITGNPDDAEEVLQEVFIILVEKLDTFRQESRFSTWSVT